MGFLSSIAKSVLPAIGSSFGPIGSAVGTGISDFIGQKSSAKAAEKDFQRQKILQDDFNQFSAQQASKQMDFQERMSSTAHQREVEDLKKAGLNPILSARYGGSSTPSGAQASTLQTPAQTVSSAVQRRHVKLQEEKLASEIDLTRAQAQSTRKEASLKGAQTTELSYKQKERLQQSINKLFAETGKASSEQVKNNFQAQVIRQITLPSGKLDIEKAKLVLEELNMTMEILRGKEGKKYITQQLGQRGGTLSGTTTTINNILHNTGRWIGEKIGEIRHGKIEE